MNGKILIVIDMQKGFLRTQDAYNLTERLRQLLSKGIFDVVIGTRFLNEENSSFEIFLDWKELKTEEEQMIVPEISCYLDHVTDKKTYSCVTPAFMDLLRQVNGGCDPEYVYIAGVDTDSCVLASAAGLFDAGICPIILSDLCWSGDGSLYHHAGLLCLERMLGMDHVIEAAQIK